MKKAILIILAFTLTGCLSINDGFPKEINGKLKSINSQQATCYAR